MVTLQTQLIAYRKQIGILEQSQALSSGGTQPKGVTAKRRTDDQGSREKGAKHRTISASHQGSTSQDKLKSTFDNIVDMFNKGVDEVVSSDPSSATRTPTSIPMTFKESASAKPQVLAPSDPRTAALASEIPSKLKKTTSDQSTPKSGDGTAGSTPSS